MNGGNVIPPTADNGSTGTVLVNPLAGIRFCRFSNRNTMKGRIRDVPTLLLAS
jgi:hypothetical protein